MAENRELALVLRLVADQFQSELKKSGGLLGEFNRFITDWKTQLAAAGGALFAIAKSTANYGEELLKTSQKVGINVQALAGLQHAAALADLSDQQLAQGLKFLSVNMVEAARRSGDGEALFRRLGFAATDTAGKLRPTEEVLLDVAEAFARTKDGAGKSEVAVKLFGRAGIDLIPFLNQGKEGIRALMQEAERLGLVLSREDAEAANRFNDELKKLQAQARGMTFAVGKELIPVLTELIELFRSLGVGTAFSAGLQFLHERFMGLNVLLKELQANAQFLSGTGKDALSFEGLKARIAEIEAEGQRKIFEFRHPGVLTSPEGTPPPGGAAPQQELGTLVDQEKLAKALVEIWQSGNRALEIRNRLQEEEDERIALANELDEEVALEQGQRIVERTSAEVRIREAAQARERDDLIANAQAWVQYYDQLGGDAQNFLAHKTALLEAQLTKELDLTQEQSKALLNAWQTHDSARAESIMQFSPVSETQKETVELNTMRQAVLNAQAANESFVDGWTEGMRRYVTQTGNGFNLATDMARRTAQIMESSFRTFFFDLMEGRIRSLKDVFRSLLDFVKQIVAQITAQLVTVGILRGLSGFAGGGVGSNPLLTNASPTGIGATGGEVVRRFALGGPVTGFGTRDTIPALLMPGEFVLSREDVREITRGNGRAPISIGITINASSGERRESGTDAAPNFAQLARQLSAIVEMKLVEEQRPGGLLAGGAR